VYILLGAPRPCIPYIKSNIYKEILIFPVTGISPDLWCCESCLLADTNAFVMAGLRFSEQCCWSFKLCGIWCCVTGKVVPKFQRIVMPSSAESGSLIKHNSITKTAISSESILAYRSENLAETIWPRFWPVLPCFHFGTKAC